MFPILLLILKKLKNLAMNRKPISILGLKISLLGIKNIIHDNLNIVFLLKRMMSYYPRWYILVLL
jgi:hypothetical protein